MKKIMMILLIIGFLLVIACSVTAIILMPYAMAGLDKILKAIEELIGIIEGVI